jgi:acyl-CoA thioester hydrolase
VPKTFILPVRVYYEDTDFSGLVYHARHLQFFERGRTEALRESGITHTELLGRDEPLAFAAWRMTIEWVAPARIDDLLEVRTRFLEARGARMRVEQELWRGDAIIARADVEAVCLTLDGKPRRLPREIVSRF